MGKNLFKSLFINMFKIKKVVDLKLCKIIILSSFTRFMATFTRFMQILFTEFYTFRMAFSSLLNVSFTHFTHRTTNTTTI